MKKVNPHSALPVLLVAALIMTFGGGRLTAIGDRIGAELADGGNSPPASRLTSNGPCDWQNGMAHKMHWPQLPDFGSSGMDVDMSFLFLADDFKCMASGPINDVHIWGSFRDDVLPSDGPGSLTFEISIYADIPATEDSWSMPGELLWSRIFGPGEYSALKVNDSPEAWYDPAKELYLPDNHIQAYQYNFCIEEDPYIQEQGKVYWLSVKELAPDNANYKFGWKTTTHKLRWNDDAVFFLAGKLFSFPLEYPKDHEYMGESLDLAFVITGSSDEGEGEHDLGDAPDSSNSFPGASMLAYPAPGVTANYPTVYGLGSPPYGPIHWQPKAMFYLGKTVTNESEADSGYDEDIKNNIDPLADLSDQDGGDDGVQLPLVLPHCQQASFDYMVTVVSNILDVAYVNVWCDWNRDGDWDDVEVCPDGTSVPEWAVHNQQLLLTGPGTLIITTPQFVCWHPQKQAEPEPMWMRITIAEQPWSWNMPAVSGGCGPAGGYDYGETEDFFIYPRTEVEPIEYDWGDAPDSAAAAGYPTRSMNNGANHVIAGPWLGDDNDKPDSESDGQPDTNALGDNNNGNDDENGATIPTLIRGETADITLDVRGGGGILQVWIDFNGDKTWQGAEKVYDHFRPNGAHTIHVPVPTSAVLGQTFARFRISTKGGLSPQGPAPDGEVEDYEVFIKEKTADIKLVQWPDLTRNGIDICVGRADGKYRSLADDFECTSNNRITTISLWGSWKNDNKGAIKQIHLSIYSDDPIGPEGKEPDNQFSKPDFWQWGRDFGPNEFQESLYHVVREPGEWWWDPVSEEYGPGGDSEIWRIDIYINPDEAFLQEGSPDNPVIYWLEVHADTEDGDFGWKTRQWPDHYMDDAVFWSCKSQPCAWRELRYPKTHPYHNLDKNSIDMAFQLTYTDEGPDYTSKPVSATQCPIAQTQCPAVATRCPPVQTQCPAIQTQCPTVKTQCPPVATNCPAVKTKCPALQTNCPAVNTECPPVSTECTGIAETKCPPVETRCPVVDTECPPLDTKCNIEPTKCPPVDTQCPAVDTECPPEPTKCSGIIETKCPSRLTGCPALETECPPTETKCPLEPTKCPTEPTKCPPIETKCPAPETECQTEDTVCPAVTTQCPIVYTQCPITLTHMTQCPAIPTRCPTEETKCPEEQTQCPTIDTKCPATPTECRTVPTKCPITLTECRQVDTECPATPTECRQVTTECPAPLTECKTEPTVCPTKDTECPYEQTKCPPVATECPVEPSPTRCPVALTKCPEEDTHCPPVNTKCPLEPSPTRCPESLTKCPPTLTECRVVDTQCEPTKCPREITACPPVNTQCPYPVETECPYEQTKCPPVVTECPVEPSPTRCPVALTKCPEEKTKCPPVNTVCPLEPSPTRCPESLTKCPPTLTECRVVDTQCEPTKCPEDYTVCPPPEPGTICLIETIVGCPIVTIVGPNCQITGLPCFLGEGTKSVPYVRKCPTIDVQVPTVITKPIAKAF